MSYFHIVFQPATHRNTSVHCQLESVEYLMLVRAASGRGAAALLSSHIALAIRCKASIDIQLHTGRIVQHL